MLEKLTHIVKENASCPWPEGGSNRGTLYPNLVAEIANSASTLAAAAHYANVSMEILARVLDDKEELQLNEASGLVRMLSMQSSNDAYEYLFSSELRLIDPLCDTGKSSILALKDRLKGEAHTIYTKKAEKAIKELKAEHAISFALYRQAMKDLDRAFLCHPYKCRPPMRCTHLTDKQD